MLVTDQIMCRVSAITMLSLNQMLGVYLELFVMVLTAADKQARYAVKVNLNKKMQEV